MAKERMGLSMVDRIALPIIVAVLAFAASLIAANVSNSGAAENQRNQIEEQKRKDDRDRRSEIYGNFMEAVATYAIPFHTAMGCLRKRSVTAQSCVDTLAEELEPERQLRSTFNRVAVYGTEQAYRAGWRLYNAMLPFGNDHVPADRAPAPVPTAAPPTSGPRREFKLAPAVPMTVPPSADSPDEMESIYDDAYNEFIRVMCAELPAVPRASC